MGADSSFPNASRAADRLGVSTKALRLYEQHGLLTPGRTAAGYRVYGPEAMSRAAEIVRLRALGLGLAQVARVLAGDPSHLDAALAVQERALDEDIRDRVAKLDKLRGLRAELAQGRLAGSGVLTQLLGRTSDIRAAFALPWPWGGERFELRDIRPLTYLIGSLGSGKTRLARCLAKSLPNAVFLGVDRVADDGGAAARSLQSDPALQARVARAVASLVEEGAVASDALTALLGAFESERFAAVVVDMVEQGLEPATQTALMTYLRRRAAGRGPYLFLMTRSSAILNLAALGPDEAIILCPANHSPPVRVAPYPGAPGYEAVATCLASPAVRARVAERA